VVEAHRVERLDRRFVMEGSRGQRGRADAVTGRDDQRVRVGRLELLDVGREVLGATRIDRPGGQGDPAARPGRRLHRAVIVVEREHLHLHVAALPLGAGGAHHEGQQTLERGRADVLGAVELV